MDALTQTNKKKADEYFQSKVFKRKKHEISIVYISPKLFVGECVKCKTQFNVIVRNKMSTTTSNLLKL